MRTVTFIRSSGLESLATIRAEADLAGSTPVIAYKVLMMLSCIYIYR